MTETNETCGRCRYWQQHGRADADGTCRRHAPRLVLGLLRAKDLRPTPADCDQALWPVTCDVHWCGEFALREADA